MDSLAHNKILYVFTIVCIYSKYVSENSRKTLKKLRFGKLLNASQKRRWMLLRMLSENRVVLIKIISKEVTRYLYQLCNLALPGKSEK